MELTQNKKEDALNQYMERLYGPIFDKLLQETQKNHMVVGPGPVQKPYSLFKPHNYRLYLDFDRTNLTLPNQGTTLGATTYKIINTTEICFPDYLGCRIVIKKHQVQITNAINPRWYRIDLYPPETVYPQVEVICREKDEEIKSVLKKFLREFGGYSELKVLNATSECKVMRDEAIDKIPRNMTFHSDSAKKVYLEPNIEFTSPVGAATYLENRSIERIAPILGGALKELAEAQIRQETQALNPLTEQIVLHLEVQRETLKTMKAIQKSLNYSKREERVQQLKHDWGW